MKKVLSYTFVFLAITALVFLFLDLFEVVTHPYIPLICYATIISFALYVALKVRPKQSKTQ